MKKSEAPKTGWYFLVVIILVYIITYLIKPNLISPALNYLLKIIIKIIPVFILIFLIMFLTNYLITPKTLADYLSKKRKRNWLIIIIAGIISTGPIYMWYPMLAELKERGLRQGFIATFLYTRAVKPALIPLMIFYFGLAYTITLTVVMIIYSIIQGLTLERICKSNQWAVSSLTRL